jgi:hypothetical protein
MPPLNSSAPPKALGFFQSSSNSFTLPCHRLSLTVCDASFQDAVRTPKGDAAGVVHIGVLRPENVGVGGK